MPRRIHAQQLHPGAVSLTPQQAHHLRKVLRLTEGEAVELFDDQGQTGSGVLKFSGSTGASVVVQSVAVAPAKAFSLTVASAIPKGERAEWMIEKLSELGVDTLIPLAAARSVVLPDRKNKQDRWLRIARESAEQSRRLGTMRIERLKTVDLAIAEMNGVGWVCSTTGSVVPIASAVRDRPSAVTIFIGPEGGWNDEELRAFANAGIVSVSLVPTILRIETAAIAAAAVMMSSSDISHQGNFMCL